MSNIYSHLEVGDEVYAIYLKSLNVYKSEIVKIEIYSDEIIVATSDGRHFSSKESDKFITRQKAIIHALIIREMDKILIDKLNHLKILK